MFRLSYELLLHLYALIQLPVLMLRKKGQRPWRAWFFADLPKMQGAFWVHAVSMGETRAIAPIVKRLKEEHPHVPIIFSSVTVTGHAEVRRTLREVDYPIYLPFDFSYVIRPLVRRVKPRGVILCETDYWFNFLDEAKKQGAYTAVVNAKLSERTANRYRRFPILRKRLLGLIDRFYVQDEVYESRFHQVGIEDERMVVSGNLKYDGSPKMLNEEEVAEWKAKLKLQGWERVVTIGSSHDPEEKELIRALAKLDHAKILLVPRHPERFELVAQLLEAEGVIWGRYSEAEKLTGKEQVVLIDAMGIMHSCYQVSDAAIVAGSYTAKVGGHNILEPLWHQVPVIFGPYMQSQPAMTDLMLRFNAGLQVPLTRIKEEVQALIERGPVRDRVVRGGQELLGGVRGSVERTWTGLNKDLASKDKA